MNSGGGRFSHSKGSWSSVVEETKYRFDGAEQLTILSHWAQTLHFIPTLTSFTCSVCPVGRDWTHTLRVSIANKSRIWNLEKGYIIVNTNNQFVIKKTPNNILYYNVMFVLYKNVRLVKTITLRRSLIKAINITWELFVSNKVLGLIKIVLLC